MYVLIESEINNDEDIYAFRGAFDHLGAAKTEMIRLMQENMDDYPWDYQHVDERCMSCFVADSDEPRSFCVRWMIFETDDPAILKFYF